jgi:hypothetical protein
MLAVVTAARGAAEQSNVRLGLPAGYLTLNPTTCRFAIPERDRAEGPTWRQLRTAFDWEDARHDAKTACLAHRKPRLSTVIVTSSGTGAAVTAVCPAGYRVSGGGSPDEVTGSSASSTTSWTVSRDHLSPKTLTAQAVCIRVSY